MYGSSSIARTRLRVLPARRTPDAKGASSGEDPGTVTWFDFDFDICSPNIRAPSAQYAEAATRRFFARRKPRRTRRTRDGDIVRVPSKRRSREKKKNKTPPRATPRETLARCLESGEPARPRASDDP